MKICPQCSSAYHHGQFCPKDGARLRDPVEGEVQLTGPPENHDELVCKVVAERFRIVRRLGQGGMGTVYEARHLYIDKRVALKLLRPEITTSAESVSRFQREAMAASTIGHENIVRIDDFGRLPDGQVYLTMEYLEGAPLSDLLASQVLPLSTVLEIARQICQGLAAAHAKGIVHRDMKSDNVYLRAGDQRVAILDFGIAKVGGAHANNLTQTGAIFGTPNYMSPEQAMGKSVDHRADVYSVGVILYEMLTGRVPFVADSFMGVLTQHLTEMPVPPRQRAPERGIPAELEAIVLRAMDKDPNQRFPDMSVFDEALRALQSSIGGATDASGQTPIPLDVVARRPDERDPSGPWSGGPTEGNFTVTAGEVVAKSSTGKPRSRQVALAMAIVVFVVGVGVLVLNWASEFQPGPSELASASTTSSASEETKTSSVPVAARRRRSRQSKAAKAEPETPRAAASEISDATVGLDGSQSDAIEGAPDTGTVQVATVRVILASVPLAARIYLDGEHVGDTPDVLTLPAGRAATVVLRRDGFKVRRVEVDTTQDSKLTIRLKRKRRPATRSRRSSGTSGGRGQSEGIRPLGPTPDQDGQDGDHSDHGDTPEESRIDGHD